LSKNRCLAENLQTTDLSCDGELCSTIDDGDDDLTRAMSRALSHRFQPSDYSEYAADVEQREFVKFP
jgi:hypothetical protein